MSTGLTPLNQALIALEIITAIAATISEVLGWKNKFSSECTSITEFIGKLFGLVKEPTLDERLTLLNQRRNELNASTSTAL